MRQILIAATCVIVLASQAPFVWAATPEQVTESIKKAVDYLYSIQKDGTWELSAGPEAGDGWGESAGQWGGRTALATYALLAAGESAQNPRLVSAIQFLKDAKITGVYAVAMRCQVWLLLPQTPEVERLMAKDATLLQRGLQSRGSAKGMYDYNLTIETDTYSHSRSQYGVLGMWAAAQSGIEVPRSYWGQVEEAWVSHQDPTGGWTYRAIGETEHALTAGMTAVGVATLFITRDYLREGDADGNTDAEKSIGLGMQWIVDNFNTIATDDRYSRDYPYATLYAIERIGAASGRKYFGDIDWYQRGAEWLVTKQEKEGSWYAPEPALLRIADTCFGILFLARGRAPVVMNKLEYVTNTDSETNTRVWNLRSRDAASITRWISTQLERELNWQIIPLDRAVEDFHDSNILYVAGNQPLNFDDEAKAKLKLFVEQGGMLLGNADRSAAGFANSFRTMGEQMFPGYQFRELPETHPIYTDQQFRRASWQTKPSVLGLSNGVRELMVLFPRGDPARAWQLSPAGINAIMYQLAGNIFLYSVDKQNLRFKGESHLIPAPEVPEEPVRTIKVARLQYSGNWDPEPAGWRQLDRRLRRDHKIALDVTTVQLPEVIDPKVDVAHLTGTDMLSLDALSQKALNDYVRAGGTLIVDAAGGSSAFAASSMENITQTFLGLQSQLEKAIPATNELYQADGQALGEVEYRAYARRNGIRQLRAPRLKGITMSGRLAVIYSAEDLSAGLVGQPVDGIKGYIPSDASRLMTQILFYASK